MSSSRSRNKQDQDNEAIKPLNKRASSSTKQDTSDSTKRKKNEKEDDIKYITKQEDMLGVAELTVDNDKSLNCSFNDKIGQEEPDETLRLMEEALNMGPLCAFTPTPIQVQTNTLHAKFRVITLSDSAYMLVLLDHNYELRDTLVNGQSFLKHNGTKTTLPVHFCWLFYADVYRALDEASENLKKANLPKLVLPAVQGFKPVAGSGGFMVCTTPSRQQVDTAIVAMRELYANFVYSDDNPYYAAKKVTLEIREFRPNLVDTMVFRVMEQLCTAKSSA